MNKPVLTVLALICLCAVVLVSCGSDGYVLNEDTFFLVMSNMQFYPEQYLGSDMEFDCFTYELDDVDGTRYICGVRKSSAEYGCTCGRDTIIGFILEYGGELPAPRNQSEDSVEKTWVHLKGQLKSADKTQITIHSYRPDGSVNPDVNEFIYFLTFSVESCELIADYSNLQYYVTK